MQIYLYQLRKEKGITQKELAQKLGISETAYRQKEKGQSAFTQDEMLVTKIIYIFHLMTMSSAVTLTLFTSPLTSTF